MTTDLLLIDVQASSEGPGENTYVDEVNPGTSAGDWAWGCAVRLPADELAGDSSTGSGNGFASSVGVSHEGREDLESFSMKPILGAVESIPQEFVKVTYVAFQEFKAILCTRPCRGSTFAVHLVSRCF